MSTIKIVHKTGFYNSQDIKSKLADFDFNYHELDSITETDLATLLNKSTILMLNRDVVGNLTSTFYNTLKENNSPLKLMAIDYTGTEWTSPELAKAAGIQISNVPSYSTRAVAEFTVATILMILKKLHAYDLTKNKTASLKFLQNEDISGKTLGIIGLGKIGTEVAKIIGGFELTVLGWNRTAKDVDGVKMIDLEKLVAESDIITIHLATNDQTRDLITYNLLKRSTKQPYLFNHTSDNLLDEQMVLQLLNEGVIKCYVNSRSYIKSAELLEHPNCISVPHQGWFTAQSLENLENTWIENATSAANGKYINLV